MQQDDGIKILVYCVVIANFLIAPIALILGIMQNSDFEAFNMRGKFLRSLKCPIAGFIIDDQHFNIKIGVSLYAFRNTGQDR